MYNTIVTTEDVDTITLEVRSTPIVGHDHNLSMECRCFSTGSYSPAFSINKKVTTNHIAHSAEY